MPKFYMFYYSIFSIFSDSNKLNQQEFSAHGAPLFVYNLIYNVFLDMQDITKKDEVTFKLFQTK